MTADAPPGQQSAHSRVAVALVTDEPTRALPRPSSPSAPNGTQGEQGTHVERLTPLTPRDDERERLASALGAGVNLGGEATPGAAECLTRLPAGGAGRVLMRSNNGAIHEVRVPIHPAGQIGVALHSGQHLGPDTRGGPAAEAIPSGAPAAEPLRQVTPRCASAEYPQDRAQNRAVVTGGASGLRPLWRKQERNELPLRVCQLESNAPAFVPRFAHTP
jgi:hypothetical protein